MYRPTSPYQYVPQENQYKSRAYSSRPGSPTVPPVSKIYTTSIGSDGRTIYHLFKAVPTSYRTSDGVVSGIQWIPAEATQILPADAQQATPEFTSSWRRGQFGADTERTLNEWGRDEEKRRRREEKEAKRVREQIRGDYDMELWKARERDSRTNSIRERRRSFNTSTPSSPHSAAASITYPVSGYPSGYDRGISGITPSYAGSTSSGTYSRDRKYSLSGAERQLNELDLNHPHRRNKSRDYSTSRERRPSHPTKYTASEIPRSLSGNLGHQPDGYDATGPYGTSGAYTGTARFYPSGTGHVSPNFRSGDLPHIGQPAGYGVSNYPSSPVPRPASTSIGQSASPFGGVQAGAYVGSRPSSPMPIPAIPSTSVASHSPVPLSQISSHVPVSAIPGDLAPVRQLAAPEGFSRPVNMANSFPPFEMIKIQDMDKFLSEFPLMPTILRPHDVFEEDWNRLTQDISLAWACKLPVLEYAPSGQQPKRSTLVKELIDLWNESFFYTRKVELILYKGKERRTGPHAGMMDKKIPSFDLSDDYYSSSCSEESDNSDSSYEASGYHNVYGQDTHPPFEAGRLRKDAKLAIKIERRRKRHERNRRRREKYRNRKYSLYLSFYSTSSSSGYSGIPHSSVPPRSGTSYRLQSGITSNYTSRIY